MRECIYCGKTLEKGEQCTCPMSVAKRQAKETGAKEQKKEKVKKEKPKKEKKQRVKRERAYKFSANDTKGSFINVWRLFVSFLKSPIETIMNPGEMSWITILIFVAFEGLIGGLCVYSALTGAMRGPISILGNAMGFGGMHGYNIIKGWLLAGLSGILSGIVMFFLYSGIFFAVNRWIMRQFSPYREFIKRFAFVALPVSILGIVSVVLGFFSQITFLLLMITGLVGSVIITYEIVKSVWYMKKPATVMYAMLGCIFVFMIIALNFMKIA